MLSAYLDNDDDGNDDDEISIYLPSLCVVCVSLRAGKKQLDLTK